METDALDVLVEKATGDMDVQLIHWNICMYVYNTA